MKTVNFSRAAIALLMMLLTTVTAWATVTWDGGAGTTDDPYYVNMPTTGTTTLDLSDGSITTFKVYDDGGASSYYSDNCNGYLVITAPEGYKINLAGSIAIKSDDDFGVWEGSDTNNFGTALISFSPYGTPFDPKYSPINITSGGNSVFIWFSPNGSGLAGWDLTVTLEEIQMPDYDITVATATNGSVAASVGGTDATTAKESQTVTLTATPADGYLLADLSVTCGGEAVELAWDVWTNSATFTMPDGPVTVTPTFTTKSDLFAIIPKTGTRTVTIPEGVTSFKVYDDGGPDGDYSPNCDGTLVINIPEGYKLQLSGSVTTDAGSGDKLHVKAADGNWRLYNEKSATAGTPKDIKTEEYSDRVTIFFLSDASNCYAGLDLTATLVGAEHNVTVVNAEGVGGSVVTASVGGESVTKATADQTVTLTASPAEGYVLGALSVRDADGKVVDLIDYMTESDMLWYTGNNTAVFTMPRSDVTVTPVFTNVMTADGGLTVNMPAMWRANTTTNTTEWKSRTKSVTIPSGVTSFKVYDYGGADCNYSDNYSGRLLLTAPEGCVLQLSGSITTQSGDADVLTAYDGNTDVSDYLLNHVSSTSDGVATAIPTVVSTVQKIEINFSTDDSDNYAGLDLTVTVISPGTDYSVSVATAEGGTMEASTTTAQLGDVVTLTATPASGCVLSGLSVTCGGQAVQTNWNVWTNSATFKMPNGDVSVTPTFTSDLANFSVNLPTWGHKDATIPEGVASFKIYDDGGANGNYTPYCRGELGLTAPEGSLLRFTGSVAGPDDKFNLKVVDYLTNFSRNDIDVTSTNNKPGISFWYTVDSATGAGLDLTATVLYAVNVATGIAGGTVTPDKAHAAAGETVTLTVTPNADYTIGTVSINGQPLEADAGVYSFTMPAANVTVGNPFRKLLTHTDITVADIPSQTYDGTVLTPVVTITDANGGSAKTLTQNEDYSLSHESCQDAGDYTVTLTGIGNYDGTTTKTFTIVPKELTVDMVSDISPQTYTGLEICPGISVTDGEKELAPDTDYSVDYSNNVNAGTATATINGVGNYGGTVEKTFEIAYPIVTTSYMDASGTLHDNIAAIPLINAMTTLAAGTYVVNSNVTFTSGITLNGNVTLILEDNCTMKANGGIVVSSDNSLTIYAQSDGGSMGVLNVEVPTSDRYSAGIGGSKGQSCGTVTINGGAIKAQGGYNGAGIGGGAGGSGGTIVINGGSVKAYGNSTSDNLGGGAGIGGGTGGTAGDITINGGTVTAQGNWYVPGIGGGINGTGGNITINGGKVTAEGGYDGDNGINGTIILGWTNATDRFYANSIRGTVTVAQGKAFTSDGTDLYCGSVNPGSINGKTLSPAVEVTLACGLTPGSGIISLTPDPSPAGEGGNENHYYAKVGQTVTVAVPSTGCTLDSITPNTVVLNDNGDGTYSFTVPAEDVIVSGGDRTAPVHSDNWVWVFGVPYQDACLACFDMDKYLPQDQDLFDDCSAMTFDHTDTRTGNDRDGWTIRRDYVVTDACGNTLHEFIEVSGRDQTPPMATNPEMKKDTLWAYAQCLCDSIRVINDLSELKTLFGLSDECTGDDISLVSKTRTFKIGNQGNHCPDTVVVAYTVADTYNNQSTFYHAQLIQDTTGPTFSIVPLDTSLCVNPDGDYVATVQRVAATATIEDIHDNCTRLQGNITVSAPTINFDPSENDNGGYTTDDNGIRTYYQVWSVTDSCGNTTRGTLEIHLYPLATIRIDSLDNQTITYGEDIKEVEVHSQYANVSVPDLGASDGITFSGNRLMGQPSAAGTYVYHPTATSWHECNSVETSVTVKVNPRPITITAASAIKKYDGKPLTSNDYICTLTPPFADMYYRILVGNDSIASVTITGSQTNVGTSQNVPREARITITTEPTADKGPSYAISYGNGTLEVIKNDTLIRVIPGSGSKVYDGTPFTMTAHDDFTVTGVPDGLTWTATADGTVTNVIPGDGEKAVNAVTSFRIFDFNNVDVTNYFTNIDISATGTLRVIPSMLYLADNADNTAIIGKFNGQGYDVTLQGRKLWKDGYWNTLCLPFDLTAAQVTTQLAPSELKELDVVNTYDEEGNVVANGTYQTKLADDGTLYLYFTDATEISAGTPYIIKWNATTPDYIENPTFKDVVIDKDASTEVTFTGGKFVGSYSPVVWQTENQSVLFLGADNKLYWPQPADADHPVTIGAFRAYFDLGSNTAREFRLFFGDDETQGIISLTPDPSRGGEGSIYTLNGVKLDKMPTRKGLYIYNGNKVVIK